jgi:hypothetical protein
MGSLDPYLDPPQLVSQPEGAGSRHAPLLLLGILPHLLQVSQQLELGSVVGKNKRLSRL